jgi:hypothetical protein
MQVVLILCVLVGAISGEIADTTYCSLHTSGKTTKIHKSSPSYRMNLTIGHTNTVRCLGSPSKFEEMIDFDEGLMKKDLFLFNSILM